jgi:hypothetical protein
MANHKIERLNLCFIWTRTFFSLFQNQAATRYPYGFFARSTAYRAKFEELRKVEHPGEGLSLPWRRTCAHSFWKHYFKGNHLWDMKPSVAWDKYLVPFRKRVKSQRISASWLKTKRAVTLEGFFYRHGVAAVITVRVRDCASLDEAVERALPARYTGSYEVKWRDGSEGSYSLSALATYLLDSFCEDALGPGEEKGKDSPFFSIATVIQGGSEYRDQPVKQGDDIHKALEALTTWTKSWPSVNPPQLEDKRFPIKHEQDNHYLYGDQQGRAVWFPKLFTPPKDGSKRYALGWYSRNLLLASLQTASLGAFLKHTADRLKTGADIPTSQKQWARGAIKALNRLSQGQDTYRTWSTRAQIEQNEFLDAMNYLKTKL